MLTPCKVKPQPTPGYLYLYSDDGPFRCPFDRHLPD